MGKTFAEVAVILYAEGARKTAWILKKNRCGNNKTRRKNRKKNANDQGAWEDIGRSWNDGYYAEGARKNRVDFEKTTSRCGNKIRRKNRKKNAEKMIVPCRWDIDCAAGCGVENDGQEAWGRY
jgi:hypothetical protein